MFLTLYWPINDDRELYPTRILVTRRPQWPPSDEGVGKSFQRNLGAFVRRPGGGLTGWVGESEICRVGSSVDVRVTGVPFLTRYGIIFKHFYSDGFGGGLFSCGISFDLDGDPPYDDLVDIVDVIVSGLSIKSRHHPITYDAYTAGELLGWLYATGTNKGNRETIAKRHVKYGPPLLAVQSRVAAIIEREGWLDSSHQGDDVVTYKIRSPLGIDLPIFASRQLVDNNGASMSRKTRMVISRLFLEMFCVECAIANLDEPKIAAMDQQGREILAERLSIRISRIAGRRLPRSREAAIDYEQLIDGFASLYRPGRLDEIVNSLKRIAARPNLVRSVVSMYDRQIRSLDSGYFAMGSTYNFHGPVGAAGDHATASDFTQQVGARFALSEQDEVVAQLKRLEEALRKTAASQSEVASLTAVVEAKEAAAKGDRLSTKQALIKAGSWVLEVAQKIGAEALVSLAKSQMGLG